MILLNSLCTIDNEYDNDKNSIYFKDIIKSYNYLFKRHFYFYDSTQDDITLVPLANKWTFRKENDTYCCFYVVLFVQQYFRKNL